MKLAPFKCVWCGRDPVPVRNGRIGSHLTPGGLKCVSIGFCAVQARNQRNQIDRKGTR